MNASNNSMLFVFTIFFIMIAILQPIFYDEFYGTSTSFDVDGLADQVGQIEPIDAITTPAAIGNILLALFFWVVGAPSWLNLVILLPIRIYFYVLIWDKIRGIGS